MKTLKAALVGLGHQGQTHLQSLAELHNSRQIEMVAICDINEKKVESTAKEYSLPYYLNYEKMFLAEDFDLIVAAVPNQVYSDLLKKAFLHDIHVLKEKPFGLNLKEALYFQEMAIKYRCVLDITQQRRFNPVYFKAKQHIDEIGNISFIDYKFTLNDTKDSWYWKQEEGGGSWYGLGWHACFIFNYFLGLPITVQNTFLSSNKRDFKYATDDTSIVFCKYDTGAVAKAVVSVVSTEKTESVYISGSKGNLKISRKEFVLTDNSGQVKQQYKLDKSEKDFYQDQMLHFINKIRNDKIEIAAEAFSVMTMVEAGITSAKNGGSIVMIQKPYMQLFEDKKNYSLCK